MKAVLLELQNEKVNVTKKSHKEKLMRICCFKPTICKILIIMSSADSKQERPILGSKKCKHTGRTHSVISTIKKSF